MSASGLFASIAVLMVMSSPTETTDDEPTSQVRTVASGSGYVTEVREEHEQQKRVSAVSEISDDRQVTPSIGAAAYQDTGSAAEGNGSVPSSQVGNVDFVDVCMYTDLGPQVVSLPACEDLTSGEADDAEQEVPNSDEPATDQAPEPIIITVTRSDFAELPLDQPRVHLQPDRGWFLVNMDTFVYTDGAPQILETTVLDVPVAVRATPVEYSWGFGDGTQPLVTTEPGAPWPAEDIAHVYTREAEGVVVTLTTTWSGEFQVAGQGPWIPIAGTTTTESQSAPFRIDAVETRLTAEG